MRLHPPTALPASYSQADGGSGHPGAPATEPHVWASACAP